MDFDVTVYLASKLLLDGHLIECVRVTAPTLRSQLLSDARVAQLELPDDIAGSLGDDELKTLVGVACVTHADAAGRCLTALELLALFSADTNAIMAAAGEVARRVAAFRGEREAAARRDAADCAGHRVDA